MLLLDGISSWLKFKLILFSEHEWPEICQTGKRQSPIAICKSRAKSKTVPPLRFYYYTFKYKAQIENTGHSVQVKISNENDNCELPTISGGPLDGEYTLDNIHFHWDSEHTINGKRYPLEGHYVHYSKQCGCLQKALDDPQGIVVLAVMFDTSNCFNPKLDNLLTSIDGVAQDVHKPRAIEGGIVVDNLLPKDKNKFFMYDGSLTTPNCNENVKWIIFEEVLRINQEQLNKLSNIETECGEPLEKNFRPLQDTNDREVWYTSNVINLKYIKDYIKEKFCKII